MKCPKCGMEIKDDAIFCKYCGSSLTQETSVPPTTTAPKKDAKGVKEKLSRIFSMILSISMIVYFVLSIGLLFANYCTLTSSEMVNHYGFNEVIELFKQINNPYSTGSVGYQIMSIANNGLCSFLLIIVLIFFAAIITFGILGIIKEAKSLKQKKGSSSDKFLIANILSASTFYALFSSIISHDMGAVLSMGAGLGCIFGLGLALLVLKLAYRFVFSFQKGKSFCFASYICIAVLVFQMIGLLNGAAGSYSVLVVTSSSTVTGSQVGFVSFFYQGMILLASYASQGYVSITEANAILAQLVVPMLLVIFIILAFAILSYFTAKNLFKEKTSITMIVFPAIMLFLSIVLTALPPIEIACLNSVNQNIATITSSLSLGSMGIASVVSSVFILAGGIVSFILKNKAKENTYLL